jgi:hypothetical protein
MGGSDSGMGRVTDIHRSNPEEPSAIRQTGNGYDGCLAIDHSDSLPSLVLFDATLNGAGFRLAGDTSSDKRFSDLRF